MTELFQSIIDKLKIELSSLYRVNTNGCWEWTGALSWDGYGSVPFYKRAFKERRAHRLMYKIHKQFNLGDSQVLHRCDNRKCINPDHLWLGTNDDNKKDCVNKQRVAHGFANGLSFILDKDIPKIKDLYATGLYTQKQIGEMFNCSQSNISLIVLGINRAKVQLKI